jgi:hypothetical protein
LPREWEAFDLSPGSIDKSLADAGQRLPNLKAHEFAVRERAKKGMTFLAVDVYSLTEDFATTLQIGKTREVPPGKLKEITAALAQEQDDEPGMVGTVSQRLVQLPAGQAGCLTWTQTYRLVRGTGRQATATLYLLLHGKQLYGLTFATGTGQSPELAAITRDTFEKIAQSFRFLDK